MYYYRKDIDGLRAVAVLSVILFHANATWLPSGFLRVDIFFVISGFLITGIIQRQIQQGEFSLLNFYQRRAKRILPVFLVVVFTTLSVGSYLMLTEDFYNLLNSAKYSLLFSANLFFGKNGNYFDATSAEKPLQHIWSLSVEEQFYFVFPLLLLFLYRRWKSLPRQKINIIFMLLICASIASFYLNYSKYDPYFLPWTRAYELLIGAWFALILPATTQPTYSFKNRILTNIATFFLFIVLILPSEWWFEKDIIPRLIICFASGYLLYIGSSAPHKIHQILSFKPFVQIGLWSYSLYLWHWVIFALLRYVYMSEELPLITISLGLALTLLLSYFSYYWVEQPARKLELSKKRFIQVITGYFLLSAIVLVGQYTYKKVYLASYEQENKKLGTAWFEEKTTCNDNQQSVNCIRGSADVKPQILAIGDSHMEQYNPFFDKVGKNENWSIHIETASGCPIFYNVFPNQIEGLKSSEHCMVLRKKLPELIQNYSIVVLAQRFSHYAQDELPNDVASNYVAEPDFLLNFENTLKWLISQGKVVYVMSDNPNSGYISMRRRLYLEEKGAHLAKPQINNIRLTDIANQKVKAIVDKYPEIHWVELDFKRYLPTDYRINGMPLYFDDDHFTPYGSGYLAEQFIKDNQQFIDKKYLH